MHEYGKRKSIVYFHSNRGGRIRAEDDKKSINAYHRIETKHEGSFGKAGACNHNAIQVKARSDEDGAAARAEVFTRGKAAVRTHKTIGVDAGVDFGYDIGVGAEAQVGKMNAAGVNIGAGLTATVDSNFGEGGKAGISFGDDRGFGVGAKAGVDDKGSVIAEAEALGFGATATFGGDHLVGAKVKAFGIGVELKIPKLRKESKRL